MANVINTLERVKLLQSQGLTPEQIIEQLPEGVARWQAEGILGIDCEEIDRELVQVFKEMA